MTEVPNSRRLAITKTELPPCCVRIHPQDNSTIILGTYKLEDNGTRNGSIDVYRYEDTKEMTLKHRYTTESAILDLKFSPFDESLIISAHSTGNIIIWKYCDDDFSLSQVENAQLFDNDTLITSIFFSPTQRNTLLATLTSGELAIINLDDLSHDILSTSHELECWTGSFGEIGDLANVVFTGGDDAKLIAHDLRDHSSIWSTSYRHHDAGVVSILSPGPNWNASNPHNLWTGSYDDNLRIFDLRIMDKLNPLLMPGYVPKSVEQQNLGGGVWRLIPSPVADDNRVLTCCMYDGARIVEPTEETFQISRYFKREHESMCYGGDWATKENFVVTCSFYDNVVQIWSPNETE